MSMIPHSPASDGRGLAIRAIESIAEYDACEELQRRAWGYGDIDVVPTNELVSVARAGGLVLGAFDRDRLAGFCFGIVGRDRSTARVYHYSRMVGVDPDYRGRGIARALKLAQREAVLEQGLDLMRWTFDPLQASNASLNLGRLGAEAIAYIRDLYGPETSSPLHKGIGTDRLLVEWRLAAPRRPPAEGGPRIAIPDDLTTLKRVPEEVARVRARLREEFERAFGEGLVAVDFRDGAYLFAKAPTP